jgi:acetyl-CoA carboxylase biotin carboxylase subunit
LEKVIVCPHHVEIQLIGDTHGNYFHFGERDCSIQRRHQKLIEETPSPLMTPDLRTRMGAAAIMGAKGVDYRGVGTIEFLVDNDLNFYFMEMNTRIQVEHPITEEAYEVDLVQDQIRVALGEKLTYRQEDIVPKWHSIECRVNAEDVEKEFRPTPGRIEAIHVPGGPGVRVDKAVYAGYTMPPYYDSMMAKLIVKARTRERAIAKMRHALDEFVVQGIPTTIPFHQQIFSHPDFVAGKYDTSFIETKFRAMQDESKKKSVTLMRPTETAMEPGSVAVEAVLTSPSNSD